MWILSRILPPTLIGKDWFIFFWHHFSSFRNQLWNEKCQRKNNTIVFIKFNEWHLLKIINLPWEEHVSSKSIEFIRLKSKKQKVRKFIYIVFPSSDKSFLRMSKSVSRFLLISSKEIFARFFSFFFS